MWVQQFSLEFAGNVVGLSQQKLQKLLVERRTTIGQVCVAIDERFVTTFPTIPEFPNYAEEWLLFIQKKLCHAKKGRQVGADKLPVEFYVASGSSGQERLAELLYKAKLQGPPISWTGGPMWAAPRKPHTTTISLQLQSFAVCRA